MRHGLDEDLLHGHEMGKKWLADLSFAARRGPVMNSQRDQMQVAGAWLAPSIKPCSFKGGCNNHHRTAFAAMSTDVLCRTTLEDIWMAEAPASVGMSSCSPEPWETMPWAPSRDWPDTVACTLGFMKDGLAFATLGRFLCLMSHHKLAMIAAVPAKTAMTMPAHA